MPSVPNLSKQDIKDWLAKIGKDREWLAALCGVKFDTINKWFSVSREFPAYALLIIGQKMKDHGLSQAADLSQVQFTLVEWETIDHARELAGYSNRRDFYRDALAEKAERIIEAEKRAEKITEMPKAAEEPAPYRTRTGNDQAL